MKKLFYCILIIFFVFGLLTNNVFAQPGMGHHGMMMESVDSEYEFLVKMIPHHEEAVYNARILKENTNREKMKEFAEDIIKVQSREIEEMKNYIEKWYPNRTNDYKYQPMMGNYEGLKGEELDYYFLEDMIFHHMGAVMMSQQLIMGDIAVHEEVYLLARDIRDSQRNEIFMMREWLDYWY